LRTLQKAFSIQDAFEAIGVALPEISSGLSAEQAFQTRNLTQLAGLEGAQADSLSFLSDRRYLKQALQSKAGAILLTPSMRALVDNKTSLLLAVDQPYTVFARLSQWVAQNIETERLAQSRDGNSPFVSATPGAFVDPSARLGKNVRLAPGVVIGPGCEIGDDVKLDAHCVIGSDCKIGARSRLFPHVVVYSDCQIGESAIIHSGTVIGSDGFGFAKSENHWVKIAQLGSVMIGDDVEIGSNCSIDRGTLEDTVIEDGCKLDNLIQVAHNVRIGAQSVLAACVGIAGSAHIGRRCMIGGSVGILGHLRIADDVTITPMSLVMSTIEQSGVYSGSSPLQSHRDWEKSAAIQRNLPDLRSRLRALEALNKSKLENL
jgi:UDP-3-O-[3-hydroxymyristoyl] glucosamine N-acyltransferase